TIKTLSDHPSKTTVALVGVADHVNELIEDHRSVERALIQIKMPRMSADELVDIIDRGCEKLGLVAPDSVKEQVVSLSAGLPHYTHLLSLHGAQRAVMDGRAELNNTDVSAAISLAVEKAQQSITSAYLKATRSVHESLFEQVLLACALAPKDDLGYFTSGD